MPKPRFDHLEFDFASPPPPLTAAPAAAPAAVPGANPQAMAAGQADEPEEVAMSGRQPVLTVTQLTRRVRTLLEQHLRVVKVEGEVSNLRRQPNGHAYFTLKDGSSQLSCVLFRGHTHARMPAVADGMQVLATGEITVYEPRGQYQLLVHDLEASGAGALQARFEALKRKLSAEGLFDAARKRPLPAFPRCIALITSPGGAAVRDMLTILRRRAPWIRLLIFPVRVQGDGAAAEIVQALATLARPLGGALPQADVIVLARGGGSIEDLWCFNDESVARAIASSPIPVVSAIGHEIDFTIADFAADHRAPTPSAAAEQVTPNGPELRQWFEATHQAMTARVRRSLDHARTVLDLLARGSLTREPARVLAQWVQQTDALGQELSQRTARTLGAAAELTGRLALQLAARHPARWVDQRRQSLDALDARLGSTLGFRLAAATERLDRATSLVNSLGPQRVLDRGFTYTTGPDGHPLGDVARLRAGDLLTTRTSSGRVESTVTAAAGQAE